MKFSHSKNQNKGLDQGKEPHATRSKNNFNKNFKKEHFTKSSDQDSNKSFKSASYFSNPKKTTSWEVSCKAYDQSVKENGHYYHQKIVLPGILRLLKIDQKTEGALLDLACGQGVLSRQLPKQMEYVGIDLSAGLIQAAKSYSCDSNREFFVADVTKNLGISKKDFDHVAVVLALQNIENPLAVFKQAFKHLKPNGQMILVLNHPCFRILRQSSWEIDQEKKVQYRRMDRYFSPMEIPIQMQPSKGEQSKQTLSFHHPLCTYTKWLKEAGFYLVEIEEWISDKISEGGAAKMENRAREEFPLFMALLAQKKRLKK